MASDLIAISPLALILDAACTGYTMKLTHLRLNMGSVPSVVLVIHCFAAIPFTCIGRLNIWFAVCSSFV